MEEQLITFETAKLAKVKGFNIPVIYGYNNLGICEDIIETDYDSDFVYQYKDINDIEITDHEKEVENWEEWIIYSAPTQSLLQKWLREKHNKHVIIIPTIIPSNEMKYYIFKGKLKWNWNELFDTYELALEVGLQKALKLI